MVFSGLLKNSFIDYPGLISCVAFTVGCNMDCWFCHNREQMNLATTTENEVISFLQSRKGMIDAVVVSGGEPTLQRDLPDFIGRVREMGFKVKLDTNGLNSSVLEGLLKADALDYVAMDIKCPIDKYSAYLPKSGNYAEEVGKSIQLIMRFAKDYEFRTTVVPELTFEDIANIASLISGAKRYYLQQYLFKNVSSDVEGYKNYSYDISTLRQWAKLVSSIVPTAAR